MATVSLQFEGVENLHLLGALGVAIALTVVACGLWRIIIGRRVAGGLATLAAGVVAAACVIAATFSGSLQTAAGKALWLTLLAAVIMLAVAVFYSAVYAYLGRRRMAVLLVLRFLAIMALLLVLFKPAMSVQPGSEDSYLILPVLIDRSASMGTVDHADLPSRYRQAAQAVAAQADRLGQHFRPAYYHFAGKTQAVDEASEMDVLEASGPDTDSTDIVGAIRQAVAGYGANELAGVILISDGLHNAGGDMLTAAQGSPVPIYAVGVGGDKDAATGRRNVRLVSVDAPLETIRNNVARIRAKVRLTGWTNIPSKIILTAGGKEVDSQQILTDANAFELPVELKWTPGDPPADATGPDVRTLKVVVEPNPAEATADDNASELHVMVVNPTLRVLYVEGTMRPEYKYLRRVLSSDPNMKFMSLVRIQENRFLAQGSIDGKQLADLPRTDDEFNFFDVLILGDVDRTFLSNDQMEKIRRFVHDGKSLLMIGGRNSFGPGGYGGTPVEAALPVLVGSRRQEQETTPFVPQLTAAGAASPVFAGLREFFGSPGKPPTKPLPDLLGCVTVASARPGANVLAIHPTRRNLAGPLAVLAVHQYGKGRAAAFTGDTTWKWYLRLQGMGAESPYHRFWGQLVRYLTGVEKKKLQKTPSVLARLGTGYVRQNDPIRISALVKDTEGQPAADAGVTVELRAAGAEKVEKLTCRQAGDGTGVYETTHKPARAGKYTVTVKAVDAAGADLGSDSLPLRVAPHSLETDRLARDVDSLKGIGAARGGRYAELAALPEIIDEIVDRKQRQLLPAAPARRFGLYNFTLLFLAFVALLTVEWYTRRTWQLQ